MALGVAIYFLYLYIWIFSARVVRGFPGGPPGGSFTSLNEKTKNENFLPELAVAFYDGLINKLLCDGARTSVRGTDHLWYYFDFLSGDVAVGCQSLSPFFICRCE